jgi:hypothetical protein
MNIKHRHLSSVISTEGVKLELRSIINDRTKKILGYYILIKNGVCVAIGKRPKLISDLLEVVKAIEAFARESHIKIPTDFNFFTTVKA